MVNILKRLFLLLTLVLWQDLRAENGYDLWLRYPRIDNQQILKNAHTQLRNFHLLGESPSLKVLRTELLLGTKGMLGKSLEEVPENQCTLLIGKFQDSKKIHDLIGSQKLEQLNNEGYLIQTIQKAGKTKLILTAKTDIGLLYGTFHLLRLLQTGEFSESISIFENPENQLRILNHWDNLDRTSERGYAGFSLWDWHKLPDYIDPRYIDYARANASIGINGTVLTNVNANAWVLKPDFLQKVKALADVFRPYGIKVYLTARFSAPIEIGGLATADPLNDEVRKWWKDKTDEIYSAIPDFGGFLVKANSEGQPGPQNYGRTHADGANMLADALAPYRGIVMWRAFVYSNEEPDDRAKQAYNEFHTLDGVFRENVLVQVKNGAIDFQPREPFHPLFGTMPKTPLMMEFQITQEYLGQSTQLVYLAPMWKEVLDADTYALGQGSTVANVVNGSLHQYPISGIAGVANTGTDINWTGHPFAQANWYAFGRLTWNSSLSSESIAKEWAAMTFTSSEPAVKAMVKMMMQSWEAAVDYMTPLGLHHMMGTGHHYGPAPWVNSLSRADWNPVYYHKADSQGIGFDRSKSGSQATAQYFPEVAKTFDDINTCPEKYLLWFHHLPWTYKMRSGKTLWEELALHYQHGIDGVRQMQKEWFALKNQIDPDRFEQVNSLLKIQEQEAIWWKDACMLYFQTFSGMSFPAELEKPKHSLEYYQSLKFPFAPGIKPDW